MRTGCARRSLVGHLLTIIPMLRLSLLFLGVLALSACSAVGDDVETITLYVDAQTVECVGVGPQECLRVRRAPDAEWELFYDAIEGFEHEPGVAYVLRVAVRDVADPPADGSSLAYRLVEVLQRTAGEG